MNWYLTCWKKYIDFDGRARRREYWWFYLGNFIIFFIIGLFITMTSDSSQLSPLVWIYSIFALATFLPSWAVTVRRLHDVGKSGWWIFISLIPLIGGLWLLILLFTDSEAASNQYGLNPKAISPIPANV